MQVFRHTGPGLPWASRPSLPGVLLARAYRGQVKELSLVRGSSFTFQLLKG